MFDDIFIVAGDEVSEFVLSGFYSFQAMSDSPCKPYSINRNGVSLGEAAAASLVSSNKKNAKINFLIQNMHIYNPGLFTSTLGINGGTALPDGNYRLFVCGTTSIVDLAGNPLNGGASDYIFNFTVQAAGGGGGGGAGGEGFGVGWEQPTRGLYSTYLGGLHHD